ncbi:MAG: DUF6049 family protein [Acidimicrobiales bacterium]
MSASGAVLGGRCRPRLTGALAVVALISLLGCSGLPGRPEPATGPGAQERPAAPDPEIPSPPPDPGGRGDPPPITLVAQSTLVGPGGEFVLEAKVAGLTSSLVPVESLEAVASVLPAVANRSAFALAAADEGPSRVPLFVSNPTNPDPTGLVTLRLAISDPDQPRQPGQVRIGRRSGVHPVVLEVGEPTPDAPQSRLVTFVTYVIDLAPPAPLLVSLVLGADHAPVTDPAPAAEALTRLQRAHDATRNLSPVVMVPPSALAEVSAVSRGLSGATPAPDVGPGPAQPLPPPRPEGQSGGSTATPDPGGSDSGGRDQAANGASPVDPPPPLTPGQARTLLAGVKARAEAAIPAPVSPYAPLDLPGLLEADLADEADRTVATGAAVSARVLGRSPDPGTWISRRALDAASVDHLVNSGVTRLVTLENTLEPVSRNITSASPFQLRGDQRRIQALAADEDLAAHLQGPDPVLAAQHLLADLAVVFLDLPGAARGVVVMPSTLPPPAALAALVAGLAGHPLVRPTPLPALFDLNPEPANSPLALRRPLPAGPGAGLPPGKDPAVIRSLRARITGLASIFADPDPGAATGASSSGGVVPGTGATGSANRNWTIDEMLLDPVVAPAHLALLDLLTADSGPGVGDRRAIVEGALAQAVAGIGIPPIGTITLTSRQSRLPITFENLTGRPARVRVGIASRSATLSFDQRDRPGQPEPFRVVVLSDRTNTTESFDVTGGTRGRFRATLKITSPDGSLVVGETEFGIRSTATPFLGVVVASGAAFFLALWWGRLIWRSRRRPPNAGTDIRDGMRVNPGTDANDVAATKALAAESTASTPARSSTSFREEGAKVPPSD